MWSSRMFWSFLAYNSDVHPDGWRLWWRCCRLPVCFWLCLRIESACVRNLFFRRLGGDELCYQTLVQWLLSREYIEPTETSAKKHHKNAVFTVRAFKSLMYCNNSHSRALCTSGWCTALSLYRLPSSWLNMSEWMNDWMNEHDRTWTSKNEHGPRYTRNGEGRMVKEDRL